MEKRGLIYLILIVLVGLALRFAFLSWNPPSLNWDEVSHGYNAYSILKTGVDQWGQKFPLINFRAYGDYPTTLNLYLTIPFISLFGLTTFAIRFPHALFGTLTIFSIYFLTFGITRKQNISLLAAFLAAISPWYVFTSRFVLQSNLSVYLLITSAAFFVNRDKNKLFFTYSLLLLILTLFSYHTTRIFSPLLLIGTLFIYRNEVKNKLVWIFASLFILLSIYIIISPGAAARGKVLFLIDQGAVNYLESARTHSNFPYIVNKLLYNRPLYFALKFSKNYISYFSPKFLFFDGGTQYQFSIPGTGLIYSVSLPFFYIGLLLLVKRALKDKNYRFILVWLLLAPIPASLTNETYTVLRSTTMLPIPELLIGLGVYFVLEKLPKNIKLIAMISYILAILICAKSYYTNYVTKYRNDYSWSWQYGYKEAVDYTAINYNGYDEIIVTKKYAEPHEYFLFFLKYDPEKYLNGSNKITYYKSGWWWVDHFDKFWFVNDWQVKLNAPEISSIQQYFLTESNQKVNCVNKKCLLITSPDNFPPGWLKLKTISFLDGKPAFEIYTNTK